MGVGFFGKLYSKGKKVSPTIKSVTPNVPTTSLQKSLRDLKIGLNESKRFLKLINFEVAR